MSAWFGLDRELVERLVRGLGGLEPAEAVGSPRADGGAEHVSVADENVGPAGIRAAFARAAWTMIAEPGDGVAGLVVGALGPAGALSAVLDRVGPTELQRRILGSEWSSGSGSTSADADAESEDPAAIPASRVLGSALERWRPRLVSADLVAACETAIEVGVRLLLPGAPGWHAGFDHLGVHAPHALWLRGSPDAPAGERTIALVGARAASGYGEHVTLEAAAGLVDRGFAIVSGAAYGIDGAAHRAALGSGGVTVAYLAGGVDRPYPAGHDALIRRIREAGGAVISESPCRSTPSKWRFLQRNRLIAAASAATVVMEAGDRSGSINTAGHAASLGRPLGAVPGPVTSPSSAGCHRLIREYAATCVTNAAQMAELAGWTAVDADAQAFASPEERRVRDVMSARSPRTVEALAKASGLSPREVTSVLGALDLAGAVEERERGWVLVGGRA
ncbi:DNA-processing protein DprA [Plantibacter sp. CFBP 8804]|uniref:DNA-processing protein DprA n=1 Tax=Plantibacter sp. CFBP 8804 TaxID=2775270 RepID=UPI001FCE3601|nr:DNA-processing protein DprA [Plantibacter sp. CFBP 8804]